MPRRTFDRDGRHGPPLLRGPAAPPGARRSSGGPPFPLAGPAVPPWNAFRMSPSWCIAQTVMNRSLGIGPRGVHRDSVPGRNSSPVSPGSGGSSATERRAGLGFRPGDGQVRRPRVTFVVRVSSRSCGDVWFRQGPDTGEREPRTPLGLVKKVAKRSTWQPPVDSRPRCLGSKVSVEATSASWVVEASLSEAAIRTSVT